MNSMFNIRLIWPNRRLHVYQVDQKDLTLVLSGGIRAIITFVLKRILASLAIASVLVALVLLVFWWRSNSHQDHFTLRDTGEKRVEVFSRQGILMITTTVNLGGMIQMQSDLVPFKRAIGWCMMIPAFWLALTLRRMLPRPGKQRRTLNAEL